MTTKKKKSKETDTTYIDKVKALLDKYQGQGNSAGFFKLEDDGDSAVVRFLLGDAEELLEKYIHVTHRVKLPKEDGKQINKHIKCLENDNCPICRSGDYPSVKMFLFLINEDDELLVWERGKTFITDILGYIERYGVLNDRDYEVVRRGKAKDAKTKYQLFPMDITDRELPEPPELIGRWVLDLSKAEMEKVVKGRYTLPSFNKKENDNGRDDGEDDDTAVF